MAEWEAQGSFDDVTRAANELKAGIEEASAHVAAGDREFQETLRAQKAKLGGPVGETPQTIDQSVAAMQRLNAARKLGGELDVKALEAIRQQTALLSEQAALRARLQFTEGQRAGGAAVGPGPAILAYEGQRANAHAAMQETERRVAALGSLAPQGTAYDVASRTPVAGLVPPGYGRPAQPEGSRQEQAAFEDPVALRQALAQTEEIKAEWARIQTELRLADQATQQLAADQARVNALVAEEANARKRANDALAADQALQAKRAAQVQAQNDYAYTRGATFADAGRIPSSAERKAITSPDIGGWSAAEQETARYNLALGQSDRYQGMSGRSTQNLTAALTQEGVATSQASNALRQHGALTTEYLSALARGETTVKEFGFQLGATVAKFAGWAAAAAGVYAVIGVVGELAKGATQAASSVTQLSRTIDNVNPQQASTAIQNLSQSTNVTVKEAGDAVFAFSRTFHSVEDATTAAGQALQAYKLDGVAIADSVKMVTALHAQYNTTAQQTVGVYNLLASGQREYNARITDMIALLQKSSGAVHNAGGDLTQLIQLGAYAQSTTQIGGAQVGTALYRSAATFLNPSTTKGRADIATAEKLGVDVTPSITQTISNAIKRSLDLTGPQRLQLSNAIFGPQYGGRVGGIFNPASVPRYLAVEKSLTPANTQGAMAEEFQKQLNTTGERMHSFSVAIGDLGAAVGNSGVVSGFNTAIEGVVKTLGLARGMANGFAGMNPTLRDATVGVEALGAVLLFMSKTRFGGSLTDFGFGPRDASGLRQYRVSQIPGIGPSDASRQRFDLRVGTSAAQDAVRAEIQGTDQALMRNAADTLVAKTKLERLTAAQLDPEKATIAELETQNVLSARITALQVERATLTAEASAQQDVATALATQQKGLRSRHGPGSYSDAEVLALGRDVGARAVGADLAEEVPLAEDAAIGRMAQLRALGGKAAGAATAAGASVAGFVSSINPLLIAMVAIPVAMGEFSNVTSQVAAATQEATDALQAPITNLGSLAEATAKLRDAATKQADSHINHGPLGLLQFAGAGVGALVAGAAPGTADAGQTITDFWLGRNPSGAMKTEGQANQLQGLGLAYAAQGAQFRKDADALVTTAQGRQQLYADSERLKAIFATLVKNQGLGPAATAQIIAAYNNNLQSAYSAAVAAQNAKKGIAPDALYQTDLAMDPKTLAANLQASDDRQQLYGPQPPATPAPTLMNLHPKPGLTESETALTGLAAMANEGAQPANVNNDTLMKLVMGAQSNYVQQVTKNAQDLIRKSSLQTTASGEEGDLSAAMTGIQTQEKLIRAKMEQFKKVPAVLAFFEQLMGLVAAQSKAIQTQMMAVWQSQSTEAQSAIQGLSPEAAIQRARVALTEAQKEIAYAKANHVDAQTMADIQNKFNTAVNTLYKDQADYAKSIVDAQSKLTVSAVTGISPQDDITRAQLTVDGARKTLAIDQTQGRGLAQTLQDQAALNDSIRALNQAEQTRTQQVSSDARAFIDAQAALAEAKTLDPVQAARDALQADIRDLATIKPKDYKTFQEYQTALLAQQAKVATDQRNVQTQIVDTRQATLQYQLHTQQITDQQYVQGLENLLKLTRLTQAQRQSILSTIYDVQHQAAVNLNVGNIKLPTSYEVRRDIAGAMQRGRIPSAVQQLAQTNYNNTVTMHIVVHRDADIKKFTTALDGALRGNFTGAAQAMGMI